MFVILVHWMIKHGIENAQQFERMWMQMKVDRNAGLYREILTKAVQAEDSKFNTFSITDQAYVTYINIGIWESIESFDRAVGKYIQAAELRRPLSADDSAPEMIASYRLPFEFKVRERIILQKLYDRTGSLELPVADL